VSERKTKHDLRSEATRERLLTAARRLFAERGYAAVGTEEIVQAAGVTRGALYHQFRDKADLFAGVAELVEAEVNDRIAEGIRSGGVADPLEAMRAGARMFLELCAEPDVERILLLDGPAVLGSVAWRELGGRYGLGQLRAILRAAMDAGAIAVQPVVPLAHLLLGALDEAALYIAHAEDPATARTECVAALDRMIRGLRD
jgi:AcrR family transcriptional regulator